MGVTAFIPQINLWVFCLKDYEDIIIPDYKIRQQDFIDAITKYNMERKIHKIGFE